MSLTCLRRQVVVSIISSKKKMPFDSSRANAVTRCCPVCESSESAPWLSKGDLRLVRCKQCTMVYANPVEPDLASGDYYDRQATSFYLTREKLEADFAPVRFERELRLFRHYCSSGRVLDVGCSTGGFLNQLQSRWPNAYTLLGNDVAIGALDYAKNRGIAVNRESFLSGTLKDSSFDAITFWAVLEHLVEPKAFLRRTARLLKPGGWCFILVPNLQSLAVNLLGAKYRYIMAEHLNYFSPLTLSRLAATEPSLARVALRCIHFNPLVIWQDQRRPQAAVSPEDRVKLLKRTTRWKQSRWLAPLRLGYAAGELILGRLGWADNLVLVLRKKAATN